MLKDTFKIAFMALCTFFSGIRSSAVSKEGFKVYWNVPTYLCQKLKPDPIDFEPILTKFGITHNKGDKFQGENMVIMYDPGNFPVMKWDDSAGKFVPHNGGYPQKGDITKHLDAFKKKVEDTIKFQNFSGVAVIDFEVWRPIFRQNWNNQTIYQNKSLEDANFDRNSAVKEFEEHAKKFMEKTLEEAKKLRPGGKWGYYGFPYCLNWKKEDNFKCPELVIQENNRTMWLWEASSALFPSVYMKKELSKEEHKTSVNERLEEAWRVAKLVHHNEPYVYPYIWFRYLNSADYLEETKFESTLESASKFEKGGAIIWGSSSDVNTKENCKKLKKYLEETIGPTVERLQKKNSKV